MQISKITDKLQTLLGVTKGEIYVVAVLFFGLLSSIAIKSLSKSETGLQNKQIEKLVYNKMDSLAEAGKATYTGTDINNTPLNPPDSLTSAKINANSDYPQYQKKALPTEKININSASKLELMKLPGVGEKSALTILEYRNNNKFKKPDDLMKIKGIGQKKYDKMKAFVVVE